MFRYRFYSTNTTIKDPIYYIGMDGRPVIKENALGALMGTNAAHTACAPVTANMAMAEAIAEAINPSSTAKTTCMRSSTSQTKTKPVTASGMPAVLNTPKAS